ncbi:MAG: hypothetical protein AAFR26_25680 [Cyanobacteria bacterium J06626_4]
MSNKFKIELELTGLKLKVEGSRDDVPLMTQAVGQQLSGMLSPAAGIVEGEIIDSNASNHSNHTGPLTTSKPSRKRNSRKKSGNSKSDSNKKAEPIDWQHDPIQWGNPQKDWKTADKAIWTLYVVKNVLEISEMTGNQISATFNKHFPEAKEIVTGNVNRDLKRAKGSNGKSALVSQNTTAEPSTWRLTEYGEAYAQSLVSEAKGSNQ